MVVYLYADVFVVIETELVCCVFTVLLATILVEDDEQAVTTLGVVAIAIANINSIQPYDLALIHI